MAASRISPVFFTNTSGSGKHRSKKGIQVMVLRRALEKARWVNQVPGLGWQEARVGGQMKFRVSGQEMVNLGLIFLGFGGAGDIKETAARFYEPGSLRKHGSLAAGECGQVIFLKPALDLRVAPQDAQS